MGTDPVDLIVPCDEAAIIPKATPLPGADRQQGLPNSFPKSGALECQPMRRNAQAKYSRDAARTAFELGRFGRSKVLSSFSSIPDLPKGFWRSFFGGDHPVACHAFFELKLESTLLRQLRYAQASLVAVDFGQCVSYLMTFFGSV